MSDSIVVKLWFQACLTLVWVAFLLLTSLYCLLAFLPYTFYALIKAPAYDWMPWFARHHAQLYWLTLLGAALAYWPERKRLRYKVVFALLLAAGMLNSARSVLPGIQSNGAAYLWAAGSLVLIILLAIIDVVSYWPDRGRPARAWSSSAAALSAVTIAILTMLGTRVQSYIEGHPATVHWKDFDLGLSSLVTHLALALIAVSVLNLVVVLSARTPWPRLVRYGAIALATLAGLAVGFSSFLDSALSFSGWPARLYAALLAATLALGSLSLALRWMSRNGRLVENAESPRRKIALVLAMTGMGALTLVVPLAIGERDWNGVLQRAFTLSLWLVLGAGFYALQRRSQAYSVPAILAVFLLTLFGYKAVQATQIVWARPLGATDDDISRAEELYASRNDSFQLAHHLLGNAPPAEPCGELCRVLRQHTNIRNADIRAQVELVTPLLPAKGERPNIFVFVIDSLRPDYLGAYNPKVDFTPNIDGFARDSAVFRQTYTQYAGTTLSEPAIWSGAMLLHAHYVRPFSNVNSLEKLAKTDGYKTIVSFDTVLQELLSSSDDMIKLDTEKELWNQLELCSTVEQLQRAMDGRPGQDQPVFFYAQPMNVHMFARNQQPKLRDTGWRRPGFNARIALEVHQVDDCMGKFFSYLKSRNLYDQSMIILASDHGDATGEFGRATHSYILYPEVMRVPLIMHLPKSMRGRFLDDRDGIATLTDIAPSLYYVLGHRPVRKNPLFGRPLFTETQQELEGYRRSEVFLASDEAAAYGLLEENGRYLYTTYDSPARSFLFDLAHDPNAEHSILNDDLKRQYDQRVLENLRMIADFYGYKPGLGSLFVSGR